MPALSSLYIKLIGGLIAALVIFGLVADRGRWMRRAHGDEAQLATICASTRAAAENPKLDCKLVPQQIRELDKSIANLKGALADQNAKVAALGAETVRQATELAQASRNADKRAQGPQATSARLEASSHAGERLTKPCEPSAALKGAWQ